MYGLFNLFYIDEAIIVTQLDNIPTQDICHVDKEDKKNGVIKRHADTFSSNQVFVFIFCLMNIKYKSKYGVIQNVNIFPYKQMSCNIFTHPPFLTDIRI